MCYAGLMWRADARADGAVQAAPRSVMEVSQVKQDLSLLQQPACARLMLQAVLGAVVSCLHNAGHCLQHAEERHEGDTDSVLVAWHLAEVECDWANTGM
jgi:hypothetical protein